MFSKTYELSLHRGYVSHWGMPHAVRELIQNALDSESPFAYEFSRSNVGQTVNADSYTLSLNSQFTTLTPQTLLLGSTSKASSTDAIGSFGEGYKIALLVLTRLNYEVEMHNGGLLWKPRFRHSKAFGEEILVVDETSLPTKTNKGLTFYVHGLTAADVETIRASCLQMQSDIGEVKHTTKGDILLDRPGKLYVGGLFVCDTGLKHSYNIKPEFLKLERDRQTVDGWDLHCLTRDMWFSTQEFDRIAKMMEAGVPDLKQAEYWAPDMVKDACYRLFIESNPGAIAVQSQDELKKWVEKGMTKTVIISSPSFYHGVTASSKYRTDHLPKQKTPTELLEAWFADHKFNMHEKCRGPFRELITESKKWRLS